MKYEIKINNAVKKDYWVSTKTKHIEDALDIIFEAIQCADVKSVELIKIKPKKGSKK